LKGVVEFQPPAKKTRFPEEAAARSARGAESLAVVHIPLVTLQISTRSLAVYVVLYPPPKKTSSPKEVAAS